MPWGLRPRGKIPQWRVLWLSIRVRAVFWISGYDFVRISIGLRSPWAGQYNRAPVPLGFLMHGNQFLRMESTRLCLKYPPTSESVSLLLHMGLSASLPNIMVSEHYPNPKLGVHTKLDRLQRVLRLPVRSRVRCQKNQD